MDLSFQSSKGALKIEVLRGVAIDILLTQMNINHPLSSVFESSYELLKACSLLAVEIIWASCRLFRFEWCERKVVNFELN